MKSIWKSILIGIGTLSVILGVIGLFLPIVPTTPFLLLAGACYMRSSEKHHQRLLENKWLGPYLRNYYEKKGIPLHAKIISVSLMWVTSGFSMIFFVKMFWGRLIILFVVLGVTALILSQKTLKPEFEHEELRGRRGLP